MIPHDEFAEVLRHPASWPVLVQRYGAERMLAQAVTEGVAPYLAWCLPDVPLLADARRAAVLDEALRAPVVAQACAVLADAGIAAMIFKGGAWAHQVYPESWCRPRLDLDLLILPADRQRAFAALQAAGFRSSGRISGAYVNHQEAFVRELAPGVACTVDLHWQLSNRVVIAAALPCEAVMSRARPATFANLRALEMDVLDSVLIACLHPVAHHPEEVRLMWWLDVVGLAAIVPSSRLDQLRTRAVQAGVASLVAHALDESRRLCLGDSSSSPLFAEAFVHSLRAAGASESSRRLLSSSRGELVDLWADLTALPSGRQRIALMREHLFPPPEFMMASYRTQRRWLVPLLHVRRLVGGGGRWLWAWLSG